MGLPIGQLDFKSNTGFSRKLSIVRDPSEDRQAGNQKAGEPWGLGVALTLSRKQDSPSSRPWVGGTLRWCTCFSLFQEAQTLPVCVGAAGSDSGQEPL